MFDTGTISIGMRSQHRLSSDTSEQHSWHMHIWLSAYVQQLFKELSYTATSTVMIHNGTICTCKLGSQPRFHNEDSHRATNTVREQQALSKNFTQSNKHCLRI